MTGQWEAICKEKTDKQSDIGTLPENEKKKRRSELGSLLRAVESAKRQVTRAIEEEGGAPHARAEEETEEESCSAESEMGAPDGAKAKPSEDKAFYQKVKALEDIVESLLTNSSDGKKKKADKECQQQEEEEEQETQQEQEDKEKESQEKKQDEEEKEKEEASERNSRETSSRKISGVRPRSQSGGEQPKRKKHADTSLQTTADPKASPPPAAESRGGEEEPQVSPPPPTPGGLATPRPGAGAGREGQVPIAALFDMISGGWLVGLSVSGGRGEWLGGGG